MIEINSIVIEHNLRILIKSIHIIYNGGKHMQILKSKYRTKDFIQIYISKEELENETVKKKISESKNNNNKVAIFVSGNQDYKKILQQIINLEVEKQNTL